MVEHLTPEEREELAAIIESRDVSLSAGPTYLPGPDFEIVALSTGKIVELPPAPMRWPTPSLEPPRERTPEVWWRRWLLRLAGYEWVLEERW